MFHLACEVNAFCSEAALMPEFFLVLQLVNHHKVEYKSRLSSSFSVVLQPVEARRGNVDTYSSKRNV